MFAGDTRQQQPVEAGPGLAADPRRRRQRPRRPHQAPEGRPRGRAGPCPQGDAGAGALQGRADQSAGSRKAILAEYEALEKKPLFTPWQVAVSEALRDGEAEKAIEAWHRPQPASSLPRRGEDPHPSRGRLGAPCARTARYIHRRARAHEGGGTGAVVADAAAGSCARTPDANRAVIEVSRDLDGRVTEPLEIAVGDRIRIGATQWEKQLFNGTVVTVEDRRSQARGRLPRCRAEARNRQAGGAHGGAGQRRFRDRVFRPHHGPAPDDGQAGHLPP